MNANCWKKRFSSLFVLFVLGTGSIATSQTLDVTNPNHRADFIKQNNEEIAARCEDLSGPITFENVDIMCVTGKIDFGTGALDSDTRYRIAYVDTGGGEAPAARELGLRFHQQYIDLIIGEHCYSACANYLVPAAHRIYMMDGAIIMQHGSKVRDAARRAIYILKQNKRPLTPDSINEERERIEKEDIVSTSEYFSDIWTNEAYLTRWNHLRLTFGRRPGYNCADTNRLMIIIGPDYLDEFGIRALRAWFPSEKERYIELLPEVVLADHYALFDFEEHPFWMPGRGFVTAESCYDEMSAEQATR
ncbi:MAG: hypothetical protein AAFN91_07915 [Pseudomonadota bacterium]